MPSLFGQRKVKITKTEFASLLDYFLLEGFGAGSSGVSLAESIAKFAEDIEIEIKNKDDINRLFQELLILYTWVIVRSCTKALRDEDKRNACLDIFHHNVYQTYYKDTTETGMSQLEKPFRKKYLEYNKAVEVVGKPRPMWSLATA